MAGIIPFDFETNAVRVVVIEDAPCFVGADVCRVLEINKYRDAMARLDEDERVSVIVDTLGGRQTMTAVSESGLYALIMMSRKPAAKRFRKWVTAEVLPAIRRDGSYSLPGADHAELAAKRAWFEALPEAHRSRGDTHAEAVRQIEALVAEGSRVGAAVAQVSAETGLSVRALYSYRRTVYMVPGADHGAALAPRWAGARGMLAECHPEALVFFLRLCAGPVRVCDAYRRTLDEAAAQGWAPVPCERTMRRAVQRLLPRGGGIARAA